MPAARGPVDRAAVAAAMAALARDGAGVAAFVDAYGSRMTAVVAGILRGYGRYDVLADDDEVQGLVLDAVLALQPVAGAWSPDGGALPWSWGHGAIRAAVAAGVGHARASTDVERLERVAGEGPPSGHELDLAALGRRHPAMGLLLEAIDALPGSALHKEAHREYRVQTFLGDPSPSVTVGRRLGLHPDNVRQIDRRLRQRLAVLVDSDDRYASLRGLPWITGRRLDRPGRGVGAAA